MSPTHTVHVPGLRSRIALKGAPLARQTACKTDVTTLARPQLLFFSSLVSNTVATPLYHLADSAGAGCATRRTQPHANHPPRVCMYGRRWAFTQLFDERGFRRVIVLEDDMELSPDFFHFFDAMAPRLDVDPTLWCVSSWNDNGQTEFVHNASAVYRSDFFPVGAFARVYSSHLWSSLRSVR